MPRSNLFFLKFSTISQAKTLSKYYFLLFFYCFFNCDERWHGRRAAGFSGGMGGHALFYDFISFSFSFSFSAIVSENVGMDDVPPPALGLRVGLGGGWRECVVRFSSFIFILLLAQEVIP
jgi:hypothetical protein